MLKDIIVNLSLGNRQDGAADFALSVANTFDAHLAAVAFRYWFELPGTIIGATALAAIAEAQRLETEQGAAQAVARFEQAAKRAGVAIDCRAPETNLAGAVGMFSEFARTYDLTIVRQPDADNPGPEELLAEAALFGAGRPVLVVPYIQKAGLKLGHVTVCWDGSRAAARAIADALPFLRKSKTVELLMVQSKEASRREIAGADMATHLARHGLKVDLERITVPDLKVAEAILSHIADSSTDLLVMGGYGHSRLREFILGGVTREIMQSMTVPTLMSH
jgi:nucleotide-binding universal stress UspA family protein